MKKLATLDVYLDDSKGEESSYTRHTSDSAPYEIILRPQSDTVNGRPAKEEDVLAHELGHFVTDVIRVYRGGHSGNQNYTTSEQLQEEKQAWHFAEITRPEVDKRTERTVLGHYEEIVRRGGKDTPVGLLKMLGLIV